MDLRTYYQTVTSDYSLQRYKTDFELNFEHWIKTLLSGKYCFSRYLTWHSWDDVGDVPGARSLGYTWYSCDDSGAHTKHPFYCYMQQQLKPVGNIFMAV